MQELKFYSPGSEKIPLFKEGVVILVDKPLDWTSFNVVTKIRNILSKIEGVKRIKVGHAGTLDPLATGLLIICTGKYTRKLEDFQAQEKVYSGEIQLGATRPSYDMETEIDEYFPTEHIDESVIQAARSKFIGEIAQKPPIFSAIKQDGERLYKKARRGEEVEVKTRNIKIWNFETLRTEKNVIEFEVQCSKGTYIRSLAYDFGKACNSGGYLKSLRRESIGEYKVENAWELKQLVQKLQEIKEQVKQGNVD